jgi:hypothetical protein
MFIEKMIKIKIINDTDPMNPREGWDNLGTMCCWHSRYNLGDKNGPDKLRTAVMTDKNYKESWEDWDSGYYKDLTDPQTMIRTAEQLGFIILPLYLYDHSGITMNTTGFYCRWDSGQVGVIFVTREKAREWFSVKRISPKMLELVKDCLRGEVETYDQYLIGDVYGFRIIEVDEDDEEIDEIDSCWGFFGDDYKTNGMIEHWPEEYQDIEPEFEWEDA